MWLLSGCCNLCIIRWHHLYISCPPNNAFRSSVHQDNTKTKHMQMKDTALEEIFLHLHARVSTAGGFFSPVILPVSVFSGYCEVESEMTVFQGLNERRDLGSNPPHWSFLETTNCLAHRLALAMTRLLLIPESWPVKWHPQWHFLLPTYFRSGMRKTEAISLSSLKKKRLVVDLQMSWGM